ncbi:hypothetical protein EMA8858_02739 [Emticicia aquatica]|uniref:Glycosyltransferase RgtA/B/C/D-like domain-containing protein n=1 Tax=Emticicia aquatica TaxID=1681835 RepID=A0ABN8EZG5_9BACT|nr:glycosyltransferase family 39 protein [Emticicia aquatica]CAH0996607.1 hypothetical protein EMA8858_02739 [Emticicia aquatica]
MSKQQKLAKKVAQKPALQPQNTITKTSGLNPTFLVVILAITTFIAYVGAFKNGFVEWDDQHYVTLNELVLNPTTANLKVLLTRIVALNYHPITMFSLAMNVIFFGKGAASFIITNVIIHVINTLLVFKFIQKLTEGKNIVAFLTALIFGLHPMHVESVAWIAERKDVLYVFFFLLSCLSYLRFREKSDSKWLIISFLLFVCSCLSKAMAVPLPIVLLLIDYWQGRDWLSVKSILEKSIFFAVALLFGLISVNVQAGGDFYGLLTMQAKNQALSSPPFSTLERIAYPMFGYLKYHIMAILPFGLSNLHPYPATGTGAANPKYFLAIAFFIASIAVMFWAYSRKKYIFFGWGFFLVTIILVLQFLSVGKAFMAERYSYLPYVGLFFMIFYGLDEYLQKPALLLSIGGFLGLICLFLTTQQVKNWKDNFTLWSNAYNNYPFDSGILESMADEYGRKAQYDKVQEFAEKALAANLQSYHTYEVLANVYGMKKDIARSLQMYDKAISLDSTIGNVYFNRGITLAESNPAKAIEDYNKSLSLPSHDKEFKIRGARASAYLKLSKFKEAIEDYTYTIENMDTNPATFYTDRAVAKYNLGDKSGAIADLQKSLSLDPSNQVAQKNLKLILAEK